MSDATTGDASVRTGRAAEARAVFDLRVVDTMAAVEPQWRALEQAAVISAYQRFDFIAAWVTNAAPGERISPRIGLVHDGAGRPVMILPFGVRAPALVGIATYLGGSHVNVAMPLVEPRFARQLGPDGMRDVLLAYCREADADLLALRYQPECWLGMPHPFLGLPRRPSPDNVARLVIDRPYEDLYRDLLSSDARSKLRRKDAKIAASGAIVERASSPDAVDRCVDTFLDQKAKRLAAMGARDPFALPGVGSFLRSAAKAALGSGAGLEFAALRDVDGIIAVRGIVRQGRQGSLMVQSYDAEHPMARLSVGEVLFARLLAEDAGGGLTQLDFGIGDARYKDVWSNAATPMFDLTLAATAIGRGQAAIESVRGRAVRAIKRNQRLFGQFKALRARLAGIRAPG